MPLDRYRNIGIMAHIDAGKVRPLKLIVHGFRPSFGHKPHHSSIRGLGSHQMQRPACGRGDCGADKLSASVAPWSPPATPVKRCCNGPALGLAPSTCALPQPCMDHARACRLTSSTSTRSGPSPPRRSFLTPNRLHPFPTAQHIHSTCLTLHTHALTLTIVCLPARPPPLSASCTTPASLTRSGRCGGGAWLGSGW